MKQPHKLYPPNSENLPNGCLSASSAGVCYLWPQQRQMSSAGQRKDEMAMCCPLCSTGSDAASSREISAVSSLRRCAAIAIFLAK